MRDMQSLTTLIKKLFNSKKQNGSSQNIYFILRHGETPYQLKEDMHYPWPEPKDGPVLLTERGKDHIEQVTKELKRENINLIFSSDINRARQTAEIVTKELGIKATFDQRLRDIHYGIYHGKTRKEFYKDFPNTIERFKTAPPEGESWSECRKRVDDFLKSVESKYQGKKILIVGHGDPLWLLEALIKGKTDEELLKEKLEGRIIKTGELRRMS